MKPTLPTLVSRLRVGAKRGAQHPGVRAYDRTVKFISLEKSMKLRNIVKGRPPMGG